MASGPPPWSLEVLKMVKTRHPLDISMPSVDQIRVGAWWIDSIRAEYIQGNLLQKERVTVKS